MFLKKEDSHDMVTNLKLIDYDFSNPHMLNFPEMYRAILNRLGSMDNYDNKYEKASRLLFIHRHVFWENADEQANDSFPNPKYTVYHSNKDTYFIINKDKINDLIKLVIYPSLEVTK